MMKSLSFSFFFLLISLSSFGQDYVDLAKFYYVKTPQTKFDSIDGSTQVQELVADIMLPIQLDSNNVILAGLFLENLSTEFEPPLGKKSVSTINLKIGLNKKLSAKWSGSFIFLPKISSDLKTITSKDYQFGGLALMKYTKKENLKYSIGLYYNQELFGPFIVPLGGIYYKSPNNKFEINATLPIWADINYQLSNWLTVGTNFSSFTRSYNLSEANNYVVKKTNEIMTYLQFHATKSILIQTKIGYATGRSYRKFNENDQVDLGFWGFRINDNRVILNPDLSDGLIFKARLLYRFIL